MDIKETNETFQDFVLNVHRLAICESKSICNGSRRGYAVMLQRMLFSSRYISLRGEIKTILGYAWTKMPICYAYGDLKVIIIDFYDEKFLHVPEYKHYWAAFITLLVGTYHPMSIQIEEKMIEEYFLCKGL